MTLHKRIHVISVGILLLIAMFFLIGASGTSQESGIEFTGEVNLMEADSIVVNGLTVRIAQAEIHGLLEVGATVRVEGTLQPNGEVIAQQVERLDITPTPTVTPSVTAMPGDDTDVIIVINGPVEAINVNIITIYGINIFVSEDDPVLPVIQIGDHIHVEGSHHSGGDTTIIFVAVNIIFIDVDVFINDGQVWRDPGNCQNAPPPWAPANGWRRRCQSGGNQGKGGSGGSRS
jgi:hypothetical protein